MKLSAIEPLCSKDFGFQQPSTSDCPLYIDDVRDRLSDSNLQQANLSLAETIAAPPKILEFKPVSAENDRLEDIRTDKRSVWFKILVIENDDLSRDRLSKMLRGKDTQVIAAKESWAGIELAQRECPDLVICELMMPEIDGYGVKFLLQHSKITEKIPLLFITTHAEQSDRDSETIFIADKNQIELVTSEKLCDAITLRVRQRHRR